MEHSNSLRNWRDLIADKRERVLTVSIGILVNNVLLSPAFDYILYPFVIWKLGLFMGGIVMVLLSTLCCYFIVLFYDWTKRDWLGIETIKQLKEYTGSTKLGRIAAWILARGDIAAMIFLSIKFDPFVTTVYMRKGAFQFSGIDKRSWIIFFSSAFISNLYWTITMYLGVSGVEYLLHAYIG